VSGSMKRSARLYDVTFETQNMYHLVKAQYQIIVHTTPCYSETGKQQYDTVPLDGTEIYNYSHKYVICS